MTNPQTETPMNVVTLDAQNSVQILSQYVELAQQKGAYLLNEAELLKRATDVLVNKGEDVAINEETACSLLIQGVHKGQRHGAYTLNDASLLCKVVQYLQQTNTPRVQQDERPTTSNLHPTSPHTVAAQEDDLSDLAEPIPLKSGGANFGPKEV